jgi:hypothetical protein
MCWCQGPIGLWGLYDIRNSNVSALLKLYFLIELAFVLVGQIPAVSPTHRVSCVARVNSGIPPIDNEQWISLTPGGKLNCHGCYIEFNEREIKGVLIVDWLTIKYVLLRRTQLKYFQANLYFTLKWLQLKMEKCDRVVQLDVLAVQFENNLSFALRRWPASPVAVHVQIRHLSKRPASVMMLCDFLFISTWFRCNIS